jgi:hypothetical protein
MRGILPDQVLRRSKSPLSGDPQWEGARRVGLGTLQSTSRIQEYVDLVRVPNQADQDMMTFWVDLRPRKLNYWLRNLQNKAQNLEKATEQVFCGI